MAKLSLKPWQIVLMPIALFIIFLIVINICYGIQEMTKLPTSPSGVPAQTDPYEYDWQLRTRQTTLTNHRGIGKETVDIGQFDIYSNNPYNHYGVDSSTMYSELYDIDDNLVGKLITNFGGVLSVDPDRVQLPASMHITFYTFFENQFYQLEAKLPREALKKAFDEITLDYAPPNLRIDPAYHNDIFFKFGLEGRVTVFVTNASRTSTRIVARYQAKKIKGSYVMDFVYDPNVIPINQDANGNFFYPLDDNPYHKLVTRETDIFTVGYLEDIKKNAPPYYEIVKAGKGVPAGFGKWEDDIQIKYPWKLEVIDPTGEWLGEYAVNYISEEQDTVLRDRIPEQTYALKPVPASFRTWVYDKPTGQRYFLEIDTYARIKHHWTRGGHITFFQDPNVDYLRKRFEYFFPNRTIADNDKPVKPEDFATLKIILDDTGKMSEIYLEKNGTKLPLDGAYHYYLAPVQEDGYWPQEGFDEYITEPKVDLTNPELSSLGDLQEDTQ